MVAKRAFVEKSHFNAMKMGPLVPVLFATCIPFFCFFKKTEISGMPFHWTGLYAPDKQN